MITTGTSSFRKFPDTRRRSVVQHPSKTRRNKKQSKTRKQRKGGALWDYFGWKTAVFQSNKTPGYNITFNGNKINCEICGKDVFTHIDVSVNRSKIGTMEAGDDATLDHPLIMYRCKTCNNCKMIYRLFGITNEERPIQEIPVTLETNQ